MTNKIKNSEVLEVTNDVILRVKPEGSNMLKRFFASLRITKSAFTLAEMLITIVIIGVVAVMTIPTLVGEIQTKSWDSASKNFETKFEQALKIMNSQGTLAYHSSTEDFINELSRNFKIANVCKDNPSDCFEDTMFWGEQTLDMTQVTSNKSFGMRSWPDSEAIGLQFANGVTAILAYNKGCRQNQFSNETNVFDCISMVYDTTAKADPNENTKDIRTINVNRLLNAGCVAFFDNGMCVSKAMFTPTALDCTKVENKKYCSEGTGSSDYWAGARKQCEEAGGRLPSQSDLVAIAEEIYGTTIKPNGITEGLTFDSTRASKYGITSGVWLWSDVELGGTYAYAWEYHATRPRWYNTNGRSGSSYRAVCVE